MQPPNRQLTKFAYASVFAILATPLLAQTPPACATLEPTIENGRIVTAIHQECVLKTGDVVSIWDGGLGRFHRAAISPAGTITESLIGDILAEGLTLSDLERAIAQKLSRYLKKPQVSISYDPTSRLKTYSVVGLVGRAGTYILTPNLKLSEALQLAGVVPSRKMRAQVIRASGLIYKVKSLTADTDIPIELWDIISVN